MMSSSDVLSHTPFSILTVRETYSIFLNKVFRSGVSVKVITTQFARMVHMIIMLNNVIVEVKKNDLKRLQKP